MSDLGDYNAALRARDTIKQLAEIEINRLRPAARYATVQSIDPTTRTATVLYPEGGDFVKVGMGAIQPSAVGQVVRVSGPMGDKYIADVMGPAVFISSAFGVIPPGVQLGRAESAATFNFPNAVNPYEGLAIPVTVPVGSDIEVEAFLPWVQLLTGTYVELQVIEDSTLVQSAIKSVPVNAFTFLSIKLIRSATPGLHTYVLGAASPGGTATSSVTAGATPITPYMVVRTA